MKKSLAICFALMLLLSLSFISAGWFGDFFGKITGKQIRGPSSCIDSDGDGYKVGVIGCGIIDCNDSNPNTNPGATEVCGNNIDDNCDGNVDEGCIKKVPIQETPSPMGPIQAGPTPIKSVPIANQTCVDSDGINYYIKGLTTGIKPKQQFPASYLDYCSSSTTLVERFCGKEGYVYDQSYACPSGCSDGACIKPNLQISIATLKNSYGIGEQIKLTDPPEITGEVVGINQNNLQNEQYFQGRNFVSQFVSPNNYLGSSYKQLNIIQDGDKIVKFSHTQEFASEGGFFNQKIFSQPKKLEYNGYILEFENSPILVKQAKLEKKAKEKKDYEFWKVSKKQVSNKLKKYSDDLEQENKKIEQRVIKKLSEIKGIPEQDIEIEKEFEDVFNGALIKQDLTPDEIKKLEKIKGVKKVIKNYKVKALLNESVPLINADDVWQMPDPNNTSQNLTGEGIKIAIIDTGIDYTHPDLGGCYGAGCKVIGGYDFINNDNDPMDDMGHGTHVAATAAGNGVLKGVAPDAKLYGFKVLGSDGSGSMAGVISGIERSIDLDNDGNIMEDPNDYVDILSMSLGGPGNPDDPVSQAVDNIVNAGVVAVIAAGNSGCENCIGSPGTARKAITVGASNKTDIIAGFSSRGPVIWGNNSLIKPDITAPGVDICAAQSSQDTLWQLISDHEGIDSHCLDTEHISISGTSMATPHVAGAVALIKQAHPDWTPDEIKMALRNTAIDIGENVITQGQGRIDVLDSVQLTNAPLVSILNEMDYTPSGQINIYGTAKGNNFSSYEVYYSIRDSGNWNLICSGTSQIDNGILCSGFDTDNLIDDKYELKLIANSSGGDSSEDYGVFEIANVKILNPLESDIYRAGDVINISLDIFNPAINFYSVNVQSEFGSLGPIGINIINNSFATWDTSGLNEGIYSLNLTFELYGNYFEEYIKNIYLDPTIKEGWPVKLNIFPQSNVFLTKDTNNSENYLTYLASGAINNMNDIMGLLNADGEYLVNWPKVFEDTFTFSILSLGDLDNDGENEICVVDVAYPNISNDLNCFKKNGTSLFGWPVSVYNLAGLINVTGIGYNTHPIISDVDNDGELEIVISFYSLSLEEGIDWGIVVYNSNGSIEDFWTIPHFCDPNWQLCGSTSSGPSLSVGDINADGKKEIIVGSGGFYFASLSSGEIWGSAQTGQDIMVFEYNGTNIGSWGPNDEITIQPPLLTDLDHDGFLEIVYLNINVSSAQLEVMSQDPPDANVLINQSLVIKDHEGEIVWSKSFPYPEKIQDFVVGDLDNDSFPEIYLVTSFVLVENESSEWGINIPYFKIYGFDYEGNLLDNFPIRFDWQVIDNTLEGVVPLSLLIGDINGDDLPDLLLRSFLNSKGVNFNFKGINRSGDIIFEKTLPTLSFPAGDVFLTDIENNGNLDFVVGVRSLVSPGPGILGAISLRIINWELNTPYNPETMDWPLPYYDPQNTRCYKCDKISRPQSKIVNKGNFSVTGNLTMKLQKKTKLQEAEKSLMIGRQISAPLSTWQDVQVVRSQQVTIPANDLIKLDVGGNYGWNLQNVEADSTGDYRVYAKFEFNNQKIEDSWEFKVIQPLVAPVID